MEEILVLTHSRWWNKANTPCMKYDVYFIYLLFCFFLHVSYVWYLQNDKVDELMNEDTNSVWEFSLFEYHNTMWIDYIANFHVEISFYVLTQN